MGEQANRTEAAEADIPDESWAAADAAGRPAAEVANHLRFSLLRNAIYHDLREAKLRLADRSLIFLGIILGSGAVAGFATAYPLIAQIGGFLIAVLGAIQFVGEFGVRAERHRVLRKSYHDLLARLAQGADVRVIDAEMNRLYGDEPPTIERDNRRAHNRAGLSLFGDAYTSA